MSLNNAHEYTKEEEEEEERQLTDQTFPPRAGNKDQFLSMETTCSTYELAPGRYKLG